MKLVYVAASSDELGRAEQAMARVREQGWRVASDWVRVIRDAGGVSNPTDVEPELRMAWSSAALEAVASADAVWLLAPEIGHARGAFVEFGCALANGKRVVVSGSQHACSIFTALAREVRTDAEGLTALRMWLE